MSTNWWGDEVAERSKALLVREKININQKNPWFALPAWAIVKKEMSKNA